MSIGFGRKFEALLRPTGGTNEIFRRHEDVTWIISIANDESGSAVRGNRSNAHTSGKLITRVWLNEDVLEDVAVIEIPRPIESDPKGTGTLKRVGGIETDCCASRRNDAPVEAPIENVALEVPICHQVRAGVKSF